MTDIRYEVFVSEGVARQRPDRLPDGGPIVSSPLTSTLITGERDAVLVDVPYTYDQVSKVGDWVAASGKHLIAIYATHAHGDHWFGTAELLKRFPDAVPYATRGTIALMHRQLEAREQLWDSDFPDLIPPSPVVYRAMPHRGLWLEGYRLDAVEVGHTDTDDTTVLHVPSIGLVIAGDAVYNGVHQMLLESAGGGLEAWLAALNVIEALRPRAVVAGHKNPDLPDDPAAIHETRQYLLDAQKLIAAQVTPQEYFDTLTARYPDRLNLGPAWYCAHGLLG
ncbi:MBL fold metallo-hydrolase [Mycobacterium colombiense]|uniref:MBL fold metallo-hydrolase n=1 Tax=Mycobacterium colombiense TaxID=339268 RepID=UPI00200B1A38|nr:MBL fold metallo-hydrolase [Mycobacterium colombiense]MCK8642352.1 MBL fold metallo-hydrolase [Mycobacterium colombiense]